VSSPYTDRFGYPLTAAQTAARMNAPKRRGYYNAEGRWVRLGATAKRTPPKPKEGGADGK
jgi:hypothetical protein